MTHTFKREYLRMPAPESEGERWLRDKAMEFHLRTERYDRSVCTGPILPGGILPANSQEHVLSERNAHKVKTEIWFQVQEAGVPWRSWTKALAEADREFRANMEALLRGVHQETHQERHERVIDSIDFYNG